MRSFSKTCALVAALAVFGAGEVQAAAGQAGGAGSLDEIQRAIGERRLLDASRLIDKARAGKNPDARLSLLTGELGLASGRFTLAIADFKAAARDPGLVGESLQGQGLAMIAMGRRAEAQAALERAVDAAPSAWRAWNALGSLYDGRRDWAKAEQAYVKAMATTDQPAIVLNNRGYSRLLQGRYELAQTDFIAALEKRADLAEARTNLRLTLALKGDYDRAVSGTRIEERGTLLNNAGFAAGVRGDYGKAQDLLQAAMESRGEFFERAHANLKFVEEVAARESPAK